MEIVDDSSDSDSGWIESCETLEAATRCLFCSNSFISPELMFKHCSSDHHFDVNDCLSKYASDAVSFIMLVNFIRHEKPLPSQLLEILPSKSWKSEMYMKPVFEDDGLLMFDIETYSGVEDCHTEKDKNEKISLLECDYKILLEKVQTYELQLKQCQTDMDKMRQTVQTLFFPQESNEEPHKMEEDGEYFSSYAHYGIHLEMLQDKTRTEAYKTAILDNSDKFADKIVLDIGCGTGILSMFCASAGAKKVLSIDQSDIVYRAMQIIRDNKLDDIIDMKKGRMEDVTFAVNKVDIIVSEWMGYFLLYEDMINSVIYARDHYLRPDGLMFPNRCTISLIALSDTDMKKKYVDFWDDVYGYTMTCMKHDVIEEAIIELVNAEKICSTPAVIKEFDLLTCSPQDAEFESQFQLELMNDGPITAFAGYFDCYFDHQLTTKVQLSTSPLSEPTHWKQTIFLLSSPIVVKKGEIVQGKIFCYQSHKERRSLIINISVGDGSHRYFLK